MVPVLAPDASTDLISRMMMAVENVEIRLRTAARTLREAGIEYAVVGGNAVAAWVATVDPGAVRNTRDVDVMLRRTDLPAARTAMEAAGFVYRHVAGMDIFLDHPKARAGDAVHLIFADEAVKPDSVVKNPPLRPVQIEGVSYLPLLDLVTIKLTAWRRKDQVHLEDMISVGLVDETWPARLPAPLAERLRTLLDDPEG